MIRSRYRFVVAAVVATIAAVTMVAARDSLSPDEWLQKMAVAVQALDYEGTVMRSVEGEMQLLKVVHKKIDGVVNERIVVQEGSGLEVIRVGDEVHRILPDSQSVLIEHWESASTLFATLPDTEIQPGAQYDVFVDGDDGRIAGHRVVKIVIRPKDSLRFEHQYWLEKNSGFPLRSEILGLDGQSVDVLKFAEISIDANIASQSLRPSVSLESYTWYASPGSTSQQEADSEWSNEDLPAGFKLTSARQEVLNTSNEPVMHLVYGDGLARVSVFISEALGTEYKKTDQRGAASSYSIESQGFLITAVGEVPAATVQAIAEGMRIR